MSKAAAAALAVPAEAEMAADESGDESAGDAPPPPTPFEMEILQPDDFHHHLRDEPFLEHTVPHAARSFGRCLVMPNLVPPVTTTQAALDYRERIMRRVPPDVPANSFVPLMTLYLTDNTTPEEIEKAKASGYVHAVKLYPAGATTNSEHGVTNYKCIMPVLEKMEEVGLLLLVHGESTDQTVDVFEREQAFYETIMPGIVSSFPSLRIVCEHITSAEGAAFVEAQGPNVAATITAHHLLYNRNALFRGGVNPHFYCLPILKREADRKKLLECAISGGRKFFLGTDSAPHALERKEAACGCAGCFTAPLAVEMVAEAFEQVGRLDALEEFVSLRGSAFYGLEPPEQCRALTREGWQVPKSFAFGDTTVRPLLAGERLRFRLLPH